MTQSNLNKWRGATPPSGMVLFGTVATVGTGMVSLAVDFRDTFYFDAANELAVFQNQLVHYWILAHIQF